MMRYTKLEHQFVQHIPERLEQGVLYVSIEYGTAVHSCCCGCGEEVVTPFTPTDWKMTFDGETISLWPSVGNWHIECRSHYIIDRGLVIEASPWTDEQIENEHRRDKSAKARFYGTETNVDSDKPVFLSSDSIRETKGFWARIKRWVDRLK